MSWQDKPTTPGVYWVHHTDTDVTTAVRISALAGGLMASLFGSDQRTFVNSYEWRHAKWFGPIEAPAYREPRDGFRREVRADIEPRVIGGVQKCGFVPASQSAAALPDASDIAKAKGLKIWNGGMHRSFVGYEEADRRGLRHNESVGVFACAKSGAELRRMLAAYHGGELQPGEENRIRHYWSEGSWGTPMAGIAPEPGIWVRYGHRSNDKPVRVWPKEKAE